MKKSLLFVSLIVFSLLISSCGAKEISIEELVLQIDKEETYESSPASLAIVYGSIEEIESDADLIVKCSLNEQKIVSLDGFPQTHSYVIVEDVYKGDISVGSLIEIIEEGGYNGKVLAGIPLISNTNNYFLMLKEYKNAYYICGAFQGRFIEREGYVFQQATADVKLADTYSPLTTEVFSMKLQNNLVEE